MKSAVRVRISRGQPDMICVRECKHHGSTEFKHDKKGYRCRKCQADRIRSRNQEHKEILVKENGGGCAICGYNKCFRALQFHHIDPSTKSFGIGKTSRSLKQLREEATKCVLLCANCHIEVEAGITLLHSVMAAQHSLKVRV